MKIRKYNLASSPPVRGGVPVRGRLARDIALIITIKVIALVFIKVVWFSDAAAPTESSVTHMLIGPDVSMSDKRNEPLGTDDDSH
ncbi:MAG: cytochrome oxidase putative small subunit CydP [Acidiferrobacterales bacterium]